jgi:hypothetical protein
MCGQVSKSEKLNAESEKLIMWQRKKGVIARCEAIPNRQSSYASRSVKFAIASYLAMTLFVLGFKQFLRVTVPSGSLAEDPDVYAMQTRCSNSTG